MVELREELAAAERGPGRVAAVRGRALEAARAGAGVGEAEGAARGA